MAARFRQIHTANPSIHGSQDFRPGGGLASPRSNKPGSHQRRRRIVANSQSDVKRELAGAVSRQYHSYMYRKKINLEFDKCIQRQLFDQTIHQMSKQTQKAINQKMISEARKICNDHKNKIDLTVLYEKRRALKALKVRFHVDHQTLGIKQKLKNRVEFNRDVHKQKMSVNQLKRLNTIQKQDYINIIYKETNGLQEYLDSVDNKIDHKQHETQDLIWELEDFQGLWKKQHQEINARLQHKIHKDGVSNKCIRNFIGYNIKHLMKKVEDKECVHQTFKRDKNSVNK